MIALSTITFDILGQITLFPDRNTSTLGSFRRRSNRTATLDGGSDLTDLGFSYSDLIFTFEITKITQDEAENIEYLIKNYPLLRISTREGFFEGALASVDINATPITFNFLPTKIMATPEPISPGL